MKVYLVLHHEIFQRGPDIYLPDEFVLHVSSTRKRAMAYIKKSGVEPYSWWEIREQIVDDFDDPKHVGWFGRRGGQLKQPPYAKAIESFKKCKADPKHWMNSCNVSDPSSCRA